MKPREFEVLQNLDDTRWQRPMDVGGHDGSHHSYTLKRLVQQGWAEEKRGGGYARGRARHAFYYRRTPAGRTAVVGTRPVDLMKRWPGSIA